MLQHTCSNEEDPVMRSDIDEDINNVILLTGEDGKIYCFNLDTVIMSIMQESNLSRYKDSFLGMDHIKLSNLSTRTELLSQLRAKGGDEATRLAALIEDAIPEVAAVVASTPVKNAFFLFLKQKIECLRYINNNILNLQKVNSSNNVRNETCRFVNLRNVVDLIRANLDTYPEEDKQEILTLRFEGYRGVGIRTLDDFLFGCLGQRLPGAQRAMVPCLGSINGALKKFYEENKSADSPEIGELSTEQFETTCDFRLAGLSGGKRRNRTNRKRKNKNKKRKSRKN
jgi:hypothetical protein